MVHAVLPQDMLYCTEEASLVCFKERSLLLTLVFSCLMNLVVCQTVMGALSLWHRTGVPSTGLKCCSAASQGGSPRLAKEVSSAFCSVFRFLWSSVDQRLGWEENGPADMWQITLTEILCKHSFNKYVYK